MTAPDYDRMRRDELPDKQRRIADALDEWLLRAHNTTSSSHDVGLLLECFEARGLLIVGDRCGATTTGVRLGGQTPPVFRCERPPHEPGDPWHRNHEGTMWRDGGDT